MFHQPIKIHMFDSVSYIIISSYKTGLHWHDRCYFIGWVIEDKN